MADLPILSILILIPAVAGLVMGALPGLSDQNVRVGTLLVTLVELVLSAWVFFAFPAGPGLQLVEDHAWIPALNIRYQLGVDGLALSMIVLTGLLSPLAVLCSWHAITRDPKGFFLSVLFLEAGMMGVFSAADLILFYLFWEVMLLPMALMIGIWGGKNREYAAVKFVLYTMLGSLLMFVAILYCYTVVAGLPGGGTFEIAQLAQTLPGKIPAAVQLWLFLAFALSFAIKVPMFPFHTWLPDAHVEAPTAGSVLLAGVLLKMGTYGFLRFAIPLFPQGALAAAPAIMALSAIGVVFGSLMCLVQTDIKKVVAYSSVAHLGFVLLGIFSGNVAAAQGGVLQMVNHGISTGALFLLVGVIYERTHTRGVKDFGGLAGVTPVYAVIFLIVTLSSIGLPGTNGFVGEFLVLLGTFQTYPVAAAVAGLGVVLGAAYMLTLYRNVFFGPLSKPEHAELEDLSTMELVTLVPLVALIFFLGVMPNAMLSLTEQPVAKVVQLIAPVAAVKGGAP